MRSYAKIHCDKCGKDIAENWWIQHVKSDCQRGLPDNSSLSHRTNHLKEKIAELQMAVADLSEQVLTISGQTLCICGHMLNEHIIEDKLSECIYLDCECKRFKVK